MWCDSLICLYKKIKVKRICLFAVWTKSDMKKWIFCWRIHPEKWKSSDLLNLYYFLLEQFFKIAILKFTNTLSFFSLLVNIQKKFNLIKKNKYIRFLLRIVLFFFYNYFMVWFRSIVNVDCKEHVPLHYRWLIWWPLIHQSAIQRRGQTRLVSWHGLGHVTRS